MKILITGATGLVGKELGKKLASKGHEIYVVTRNKEKAGKECPFPHIAITWSELNTPEAPQGIEAIVNLAGAGVNDRRWSKKYKQEMYDSRVKNTTQLVEWVNHHCPNLQAFVSTSAIGIYGKTDQNPTPEEAPKSYDFLGSLCQDWEAPLADLKYGRGVILRVGIVFSEKGGALAEMVPPIQGKYGGCLGSGQQLMSWVDIDDLVGMYIFAIENSVSGVFNATAPNPASNKDIASSIAQHLGVRLGPSVPYFALRLAVGEIAPHLVESQKIDSSKIQKAGYRFQYSKIEESLQVRVPQLKGTERRFICEQWVPKTKTEIFPFFSDANNLEAITPDELHFKILNISTDNVQAGTEINYKLRVDGVPIRWKTLIKDWNPPHMFSDNQEKGPYRKWYHVHHFEELAGGTLMTDQVNYQLPLGVVGHMVASWKVRRDIEHIFKYRKQIIKKIFG